MSVIIRPLDHQSVSDLEALARINLTVFHGHTSQLRAEDWIEAHCGAYPVYQFFVAEVSGVVAGYIFWQLHGGFEREQLVAELEQLAIDSAFQGQGIGSSLIEESRRQMIDWLKTNCPQSQQVVLTVWFYEDNLAASRTYAKFFAEEAGWRNQYGRKELMRRTVVNLK